MAVFDIGWNMLEACAPEDVCARTGAAHDAETQTYRIPVFGRDAVVNLRERTTSLPSFGEKPFPEHAEEHLVPALLWYLAKAQDIPLVNDWVAAQDLPGGQIFVKGTHVLPTGGIDFRYGKDLEGFCQRGETLGGRRLEWGDASVCLPTLPCVPVALVYWAADEDFPSKLSILYDRGAPAQLPTDMLWALAMASVFQMSEG